MTRLKLALLVATCLASQAGFALPIRYTAQMHVERNDNLLLQETDPVQATVLRPSLDFEADHRSSALDLAIAGRFHYYDYNTQVVDNAFEGLLDARANWHVIPERLTLTAEDSLSMLPVDSLAADVPGNRQRVNILSVGPTLHFRPGARATGQLEARHVIIDAEQNEAFNSSRNDLRFRLNAELTPTDTVGANLQQQSVKFDAEGTLGDYSRSDMFVRWHHRAARFDFTADAGVTWLDYRGEEENRRNPLFRLQSTWNPTPDHRLALRWSREYSDIAAWSLAGLDGQIRPGEGMSLDLVVANASPFVVRQFDLEYGFRRARWEFLFAPYVNKLRYVEGTEFNRDGRGYAADLNFRLRDTLTAGIHGSWDSNEYVATQRNINVRRYGVYAEQQLSRHWHLRLEANRYTRSENLFNERQRQNTIAISIAYTNFQD